MAGTEATLKPGVDLRAPAAGPSPSWPRPSAHSLRKKLPAASTSRLTRSALKYKGKKFTVPGIKVAQPDGNERAVDVSLVEDAEHNLVLDRPGKYGNGIFVFYKPADATFGYADHGVTWACSGPYQGCHFQLGVHNGRIYAAHIAVESGGPGRPAQDHSEKLRKLLPEAIVKADHKTTLKEIGKAARVLGEHVSKYAFAHWGGNFAELTVTELTIIRGIDKGEIVSVDKVV